MDRAHSIWNRWHSFLAGAALLAGHAQADGGSTGSAAGQGDASATAWAGIDLSGVSSAVIWAPLLLITGICFVALLVLIWQQRERTRRQTLVSRMSLLSGGSSPIPITGRLVRD